MSEEEIIEILEAVKKKDTYWLTTEEFKAMVGLLDLYNKQKEENNKNYYEWRHLEAEVSNNYISKDKIKKELLEPINKERQEVYKDFIEKSKANYFGIEGSVLQELNWIVGTIEELLGE